MLFRLCVENFLLLFAGTHVAQRLGPLLQNMRSGFFFGCNAALQRMSKDFLETLARLWPVVQHTSKDFLETLARPCAALLKSMRVVLL